MGDEIEGSDSTGTSGLFVLADWANRDGVTYTSNEHLSEKLELDPVTVRKVRAGLVKRGRLTVVHRKLQDGSSISNMYRVGPVT